MSRANALVVSGTLAAALCAGGCILPVSTGAPLPPTTVGRGRVGISVSAEAPVLDLLAGDSSGSEDPDFDELHGAAPAAASTLTVAYGVGENTDIELSGEVALYYFFLPLPTGGALGVRHHIAATDLFDFGIAARIGGVSGGLTSSDDGTSSENDTSASAVYGAIQGIVQTRSGFVRPMVSLNLMPFRIKRDPSDVAPFSFSGLASSATFGLMLVGRGAQFGPYVTVTNFESSRFGGGWFTSGGLMMAVRPDRNRPKPPPMPPPGYAPPAPFPPPGGPPPPAPFPPPGEPYPPPAPGPTPTPEPPPMGPPGGTP